MDWEKDWWLAAIPVAVLVGVLVSPRKAKASSKTTTQSGEPSNYPLPKNKGVPFAKAPASAVWPIHESSTHSRKYEVPYRDVNGKNYGNAARAFKASRDERYHAGIDLYANPGDVVVAPEAGVLIAEQNFLPTIPGDDAVLLQGDSGNVILLGEIVANSFEDFGLSLGSRVKAGQPVAKIGLTEKGNHMLHFETYAQGTTKNSKWYKGKLAPASLRDPTEYLLKARQQTLT